MYDYMIQNYVEIKGYDNSSQDIRYGADFLNCKINKYVLQTTYFIKLTCQPHNIFHIYIDAHEDEKHKH